MTMSWTKHHRRDETSLANRRHWILKGTDGRTIEHRSKLGSPVCYYAVCPMTSLISQHRTKRAAMRAVERFVCERERAGAHRV